MGLSTFAIKFRRRFSPAYPRKKAVATKLSTANKPVDPLHPRRLKSLKLTDLLTHLLALQTPLPQSTVDAIAARLADDLLPDLVAVLTSPSASFAESRESHPHLWVATTLITHGHPDIRDALAERQDLIHQLVQVFNVEPQALSPYRATNVADVLCTIIHENPKSVVSIVSKTNLPEYLIRHVALQPAADLLSRLIAARVFSPLPAPPLVPMHKKAWAMLGRVKVQERLSKEFLKAVEQVGSAKCEKKKLLAQTLSNTSNAMVELSNRAMAIPRKLEDADERADMGYAGNLGLVTSHMFNDAKDHMTLLKYPEPLLNIVEAALDESEEAIVFNAAMSAVVHCLASLRESRVSPIPSIKKAVSCVHGTPLGDGLARLSRDFARLLMDESEKFGRKRLLVVDVIREFCETLPEQCVKDLLTGDDDYLLNQIMASSLRFPNVDQLQVRVSQILHAVFVRFEELTLSIVVRTNVLDYLSKRQESPVILEALSALFEYGDKLDKLDKMKQGQHDQLMRLAEFHEERKAQIGMYHLTRAKTARVNVSNDLIKELDRENDLIAHECYGQELYLHALLEEVGRGAGESPPSDSHVAEKAADITSKASKTLSGRLKNAYHQYK